ncbi:MAG: DNA polymerase III subunit delta [Planctomycetota bacterium]|nr:DNA polymerase III subunit delta [Planctomycetota bacterium]
MMEYGEFERSYRSAAGAQPVAYAFIGNQFFLARRGVALVLQRLGADCCVTNQDCTRPPEDGTPIAAAVFGALYNATFLAGTRAVVVDNAQDLLKNEAARLGAFAAKPPRGACLCLIAPREAARLSAVSKPAKGWVVVDCSSPDRVGEAGRWFEHWVKLLLAERGKKMSDQALRLFLARSSGDLGDAAAQLDKLCMYVGPRGILSPSDIDKLVVDDSRHTAFQIGNAVLEGKPGLALELVRALFDSGKRPEDVLGALVWQLHALRKAAAEDETGRRKNGGGSYPDRYARLARNIPDSRLNAAFQAAYEADRDVKTGTMQPETAFDLLAVRLARALGAGKI